MTAETSDRQAAAAVVRHHTQLAADLDSRTTAVLAAAERGAADEDRRARRDLLTWLRDELLPHAQAEEETLYPAAAADPAATDLITGMMNEHEAIGSLVNEIEGATSPVRAAAAARALSALFAVHLAKENDLILPRLVDNPDVSVAQLLAGMHALLGHEEPREGAAADEAPAGCAGDGSCGCGGDGGGSAAEAAVLSIDPRLDVREIPHSRRHAAVLAALEGTAPGAALVLVAPHAPRPLLHEVQQRYGEQFTVDWLQDGPEIWQIRLERARATA